MGLDMYLTRKVYVKNWGDSEDFHVSVTYKGQPTSINGKRVSYIVEDVGYWRKANAIHNWFVQNVQDGNDDCGEYHVSMDALKQLMEECQRVLANPDEAEDALPTTTGFFFGSVQYDEYYRQDLVNTIRICEDALKMSERDKDDFRSHFSYQASW